MILEVLGGEDTDDDVEHQSGREDGMKETDPFLSAESPQLQNLGRVDIKGSLS